MSTGPLDPNNLASTLSASLNSATDAINGLRQDVSNLSSDVQQGSAQSSAQSASASIEQYLNVVQPPPSSSPPPTGGPRRLGGRSGPQRTSAQSMQDWIDENLPLSPITEEQPEYATPQEDIDFQPTSGLGARGYSSAQQGFQYGIRNLSRRLRGHRQVGWGQTVANITEDFGFGEQLSEASLALTAGGFAKWGAQNLLNQVSQPLVSANAPFMTQASNQVVGGMASSAASVGGGIVGGAVAGLMLSGGNPAGAAAGAAIGGALELARLPQQIIDWSNALLQSQYQLSAFNGTIQKSAMEAERREFLRNIETGRETGGSTQMLTESFQKLADTLRPFKSETTNELSIGLAGVMELLNISLKIYRWLDTISQVAVPTGQAKKLVQLLINWLSKEDESDTNFDDWMNYWRGKPIAPQGPPRR
jgi:hypothetical protein